ncbi:uncharacterized protein LOC116123364 [Pistacia vera]|uniref:uncharacterized protein LOC116123364 n=1 Tax=Pistacia vera TaxID=55513 RepID=UPI001263A0A5|nr:uncharacterized protein LOC116123364 [Pistacia vera]
MSDVELQQKREKGLCFHCDEKYGPNHYCQSKSIQVLLVTDDDRAENDYGSPEPTSEISDEGNPLALSMHSIVGVTIDKTLKLKRVIGGIEVIVLVDNGASHNFISHELVRKLELPVERGKSFRVMVGNGFTIRREGICRGVPLRMQGIELCQDYFPFELGGADVVLGISWLSTLGDVCANWRNLTMEFFNERKKVVLQGDPSLVKTVVSLRAMLKSLQREDAGYVVELCSIVVKEEETEEPMDPAAAVVVDGFSHLFEQPTTLPPKRPTDHTIVLETNTKPPNIHPYKYLFTQKNEIERLVGEMLMAGIIQPSTSPFASPVLLVKKKDGSWRFCVNYRALNNITIPDKFPIPSIDELLDELSGAAIFTKLDLKSCYHQIQVKEEDVPKTAFRTHEGHYEFLVMPFGLTNTPSTFQALMNTIFKSVLRKFILVFFDDILIYSPDLKTHLPHMQHTF